MNMKRFTGICWGEMNSEQIDQILWQHISTLPYFRGFLRAVEHSLYQEISLSEPVLDLGSGDGHFASTAFEQLLDVGLDPNLKATKEAKTRNGYRHLVLAEGRKIPFCDGYFASVISTSVLEHIPDIEPVIGEIARVLQLGGKLIFCVPNHRFPEMLWGRQFLQGLGLSKLGARYSRFFNQIARHAHTDSPEIWQARLERAGLQLLDSWDYFSPEALAVLEWGHPLGLPSLVFKKLFNRWVLSPYRWNLVLPWRLTRKHLDHPRDEKGVCSFFIAQKR